MIIENETQMAELFAEGGPGVGAVAFEYADGSQAPCHTHPWAQLVHAIAGTMTVETPDGAWVVPPGRAVWIPAGVEHGIAMHGAVEMRTLYANDAWAAGLPEGCGVLSVGPLLRELIIEAVAFGPELPAGGHERRLFGVLLDQVRLAPATPLHLPWPRDDRAVAIATALREEPSDGRALADWGREVGASSRTLSRLFGREVGMSFGEWRRQLRLVHALELLGQRTPVTECALAVGYESPAAFAAMFRRALGCSPTEYVPERAPVRPELRGERPAGAGDVELGAHYDGRGGETG